MASPEAWHAGRTMRILELLAFAPLSAPQLADALHAHPRTVRRVLGRLVAEGYLTQSEEGRRLYEPTMRLVALAGQVVERSPIVRRARPYVALLHERTGATAHLVVPSYRSVICLVHRAAGEPDDAAPRLRELVPAHCTAGGKALLAFRDRWRESLLASPLEGFTKRTVTDAGALRRELEAVRQAGHATEDGEYQPRMRAVAAPVFRAGGDIVGALSVSAQRLDLAAATHDVVRTARELSDDLRGGA
jgi:DNA-binding IclR family transcriptional regulator